MLTTLEAAKGMQRKHSNLMRDIDRLRSILPPDFAATAFTRTRKSAPPESGNDSSISPAMLCLSSSWDKLRNMKSCG